MKKIIFSALVVSLGFLVFSAFLMPHMAAAQSVSGVGTPSTSDLLAAVDALQTVDAARQNILSQVGLQFAQVTQEVQNLASEPRNTTNEQQAFTAELGAVTAKLSQLSTSIAALNQIQVTENSLTATIQADMRALGILL